MALFGLAYLPSALLLESSIWILVAGDSEAYGEQSVLVGVALLL